MILSGHSVEMERIQYSKIQIITILNLINKRHEKF
jgi:hypothetical protein